MEITVLESTSEIESGSSDAFDPTRQQECDGVRFRSGGSAPRRAIPLSRRLLYSLVPVTVLLLAVELIARVVVPGAAAGARFGQIEQIIVYLGNRPGESIFEPDPDCFWRLKPNVVLPLDRGDAWGGRMSNSHGLRSREVSVEQAMTRKRILCFGDSSTFAFGVGFSDAWPNQMQQQLEDARPGEYEVLNAGIPGQSSYQGRQRLARTLDQWKPHQVLITFGNNDGWRWDGLSDREHNAQGQSAGQNSLLNVSRTWQMLMAWRHGDAHRRATQQQLEWARQATWNYFDPQQSWTPRVEVAEFAENLRAMIRECRDHGAEPVLVVWPDQRQLIGQPTWRPPYQEALRDVARETDVPCLDLVPLFEQLGDAAVERFLPNDVVHLDRRGNTWVADAARQVLGLP